MSTELTDLRSTRPSEHAWWGDDGDGAGRREHVRSRASLDRDLPTIRVPRRLPGVLAGISIVLVLVSVALELYVGLGGPDFLGLDTLHWVMDTGEQSIPTWFNATLYLVCGVLCVLIGAAARASGDYFRRHWFGLSGLFVVLSIDEIAMMHERLALLMDRIPGATTFFWVVPGALFLVVLAVVLYRFLTSLPRDVRWLVLGGGAVFAIGALGLEAVSGVIRVAEGQTLRYELVTNLEEACEMLGLVIAIGGLLRHARRVGGTFAISVEG